MVKEIVDDHFREATEISDEVADDHLTRHSRDGDVEMGYAMANKSGDRLSSHIDQKLRTLSAEPFVGNIFKVPEILRNVNEKAYEPRILAIGPYHRGKNHLNAMEKHKMRYLKLLLRRRGESSTINCVAAMRGLERKACASYVDSINLQSDEFVEMMLLDACFIIELLRKCVGRHFPVDDPVLKGGWIMTTMKRDLLLIENQLPFFVLQKLFDMTETPNEESLCLLILKFFNHMPKAGLPKDEDYIQNADHLLGLLQWSWRYRHREIVLNEFTNKETKPSSQWTCIRSKNDICSWICSRLHSSKPQDDLRFIRCATELQEAGIKFQKLESDDLFNIKLKHGILKVPTLRIHDHSESFFRNLIAYEQFYQDSRMNNVSDYIKFMDCLIDTSKDVELLCKREILENGLGNDEVLANMFNRLCDNVTGFAGSFIYREIFLEINQHCDRRWNKWKANLRHNYFRTPWALISVLAALLLLLLTVTQTLLSFLAYMK